LDLQDFWQESKRWVLGVLAGLIVFWIGGKVVDAVFGGANASGRAIGLARSLQGTEYFDAEALSAARAQNEGLTALLARVREHSGFVPDEDFVLAGKGDPDLYFPEVERRVRQRVVSRAQERSVSIDEGDLTWPAAVTRDEKAETMVGLCVLEHAALRLVEASEEVRQRLPDALGLQGIESFAIDRPGTARSPRGPRGTANDDLAGLVDEHRVRFRFRADVPTLQAWLTRLRAERPTIGLAPELRVTPGDQIGDPVTVQGILSAIVLHEPTAQDG
jgi:hypothetical protein